MDNQDFATRYFSDQASSGDNADEAAEGKKDPLTEPALPPEPEVSEPSRPVDDPTIVGPMPAEVAEVIARHAAQPDTARRPDQRQAEAPASRRLPAPPATAEGAPWPQQYPGQYQQPGQHQPVNGQQQAHQGSQTGQWHARQPYPDAHGVAVSRPGSDSETAAPLQIASWAAASNGSLTPAWASEATRHLRHDDLVKTRRIPPEEGWRHAVYVGSGHLVNLGAGPAERLQLERQAQIAGNIPGNYQVAVVSIKGGVGKTRTTAGIGTVFAMYRNEPVIAIDANPTYGALGRVVDPRATSTIREYHADGEEIAKRKHTDTYPQSRARTGQNPQGLEVLAGNQNVANPLGLTSDMFNTTLARTRRFYQLALIDCGANVEHEVMPAVLRAANALVIVGTANFDGAAAAEQTIDWLAARGKHDLLRRSVVVLNDVYDCAEKKFVTAVTHSLEQRVGAVKFVPFDEHLRDGAVLDFDALRKPTRLAYTEIAAWVAEGFPTPGGVSPR
ncbi:nucleotide-binding protein [Mycobacterium sp. NPDC004974]|jgi:MinD-like ATPase involved in chromosome partitioning or flagellar assembly